MAAAMANEDRVPISTFINTLIGKEFIMRGFDPDTLGPRSRKQKRKQKQKGNGAG
jgi:hypothetical protein